MATPSYTTALSVDDLSLVTKCTFNSSGTGHAVDLGTFADGSKYHSSPTEYEVKANF